MRVFSLALLLLLIAAVSYVFYLDKKLEPIVNAPGIRREATGFTPVKVVNKRKIHLGYASFSVPESIRGDPVEIDPSGIVSIGPESHCSLVFYPPQNDHDAVIADLLQTTSSLMGEPVKSLFEFKKLVLAQEPFSVWQSLGLGRRKAAARASLLLLKSLEFSPTISVRLLENDQMGLIVSTRAGFTHVLISDFKSGTSQTFLITSLVKDVDEVVSAIASDDEVHLTGTDLASVQRLLESAGVKPAASSRTLDQTFGATSTPLNEAERRKAIADEIRRRSVLGDGKRKMPSD